MKSTQIKDVASFNQGIEAAANILRQQFFSGNIEGCGSAIAEIEKLSLPVMENGIFRTDIPNYIEEEVVEPDDILEKI